MKKIKLVENFFHLMVIIKNFAYNKNYFNTARLPIPVVSVGNISFGGAGKTPTVILLAEELSKTKKLSIVCKSYKTDLKSPTEVIIEKNNSTAIFGDEACLIKSAVPNCRVWSGPDKTQTAMAALSSNCDLILIDDGFSHRKLKRNFDLLLIDTTQGFETYLREPLEELKRAHAILLTKVNLSSPEKVKKIRESVISMCPDLKDSIFESNTETRLELSTDNPLFVFCGIARPETLIGELKLLGYNIFHTRIFADHYGYPEQTQESILNDFFKLKKDLPLLSLVTTEKDFVKITNSDLKNAVSVTNHKISITGGRKGDLIEKIRSSF